MQEVGLKFPDIRKEGIFIVAVSERNASAALTEYIKRKKIAVFL